MLLALLALLWGSSYLFIKIAVAEIPPLSLMALRVTIAGIFLIVVLNWRRERLPRDGKTWRMLLVQSFLTGIGAWTVLAWGQQYVDSGLASVLNSTSPIFVFLFTYLITRHEATSGLKLFGALLGLLGVVLIVGVDALAGLGQQVVGQLAAICGAVLYACAAIYGKRLAHLSATAIATGTMIWAVIILVPASLIVERPWTLSPSASALMSAFILAIFCTGCALLIYFRLLKTLGSLGVASQAYLRAGVGVLLGMVFLGEKITPVMAAGLLAAIIGVAAINMPTKTKQQ
ncbi:MAG: EamA family transporter [Rhizobiaceae bacterium]|nr:EamA family transporter [Rhizobiaceae bacterium]